jgi:hypothetical protein
MAGSPGCDPAIAQVIHVDAIFTTAENGKHGKLSGFDPS